MEDIKIKINISLDELFEFIYWCSHFKKYNKLCCKLEELKIPVMTVTSDKDGEIQKIIYEKENELTIRNKYLIDDQFLEPLGLNLHSLIYVATNICIPINKTILEKTMRVIIPYPVRK